MSKTIHCENHNFCIYLGKKHLKSDDDEEEEEEEEQDKCTMSFCYGDPENAFV